MAQEIKAGEGFRVFAWGDVWLVRLLDNFGRKTAAELEAALASPELSSAENSKPIIIETFACSRIFPTEARFFLQQKKKTPLLGVLARQSYVVSLRDAGLSSAIACGTTLREVLGALKAKYRPKVDAEFINPFLEGALRAISVQAGLSTEAGKAYLIKEPVPAAIAGVIPLVSPMLSGVITLEFPKETFTQLASKILGESVSELSAETESLAAELTGIIYGAGRVKANENGYCLDQSLPCVLRGANAGLAGKPMLAIGIPLKTDAGPIVFTVRVDVGTS
jgi:CheY-specific phosphatase CheX